VVELLLTLAIPRKDVKPFAKALLRRFGSLRGILDASSTELQEVKGIGASIPIALQIIRELSVLYLEQSADREVSPTDMEALGRFWRMRIGALKAEVFEVIHLDSANRPIRPGVERIEEGTVDRAAVYPRRLVESALRRGSAALVLAHNHPNGNVAPSEHDKTLTRALVLAAEAVHLKILDHFIVSPDEVFSFRRAGLL